MTQIVTHSFTTKIAGWSFRGTAWDELLSLTEPGTQLYLRPEPDNPFDENAIKVLAIDHKASARAADADETPETREPLYVHLGYIPRTQTSPILQALELGGTVYVEAQTGVGISVDIKVPGKGVKWDDRRGCFVQTEDTPFDSLPDYIPNKGDSNQ